MKIIIRSKNIEPSKSIDTFIEEKIGGLKKFINILRKEGTIGKPLVEVFVEVEKETRHHQKGPFFRVEVQMHLPGKSIRCEATREDLRSAIVEVKDEMQQEIKRYKLRKIDLRRRQARSLKKSLHIAPDARFRKNKS
ncbi:ribosome-associated translation inhibitor RaiA [Patescibacteria group bacterium]|nr:ribosome-associated translation inhibitor RaiA [Patescibacteria group bacterium]MBU4367650.1 ribosome-associated translation inhibitor RaiA [Patescibacteria group bacterium]MBU4461900.1 ribosome-associated translation inhibitor RaiA [Patescibacteria group bacterium]MCG2699969.1 ribosome-associated translation inhibitor RaiA [Candidatus Parcubacteria bacterium]